MLYEYGGSACQSISQQSISTKYPYLRKYTHNNLVEFLVFHFFSFSFVCMYIWCNSISRIYIMRVSFFFFENENQRNEIQRFSRDQPQTR